MVVQKLLRASVRVYRVACGPDYTVAAAMQPEGSSCIYSWGAGFGVSAVRACEDPLRHGR